MQTKLIDLQSQQIDCRQTNRLLKRPKSATAPKNHLTVVLPRGEAIRNFVYTDCLAQIADAAQVSLLTVSPNAKIDELLGEKFEDVRRLETHEEKWIVHFAREILDLAHNRWLWSKAAQHRWHLREIEANDWRQRAVRLAKKTIGFPFANRRGLRLLSKIERAASRRLKTTDAYLKLFRESKPSLVFNGSHVHSQVATQAIQAAQWLGIPTATFVFSWDNLTSQGRIMLPYDYFLVWNEQLKAQFLKMYDQVRPEQVFVTGTPQFDFHFRPEFYQSRAEFCASIGADPERPIVLYSTGMANHMPDEPEIVEEIARFLGEIGGSPQPQLLVRVYPKDLTNRFEDLKKRRPEILFPVVAWEQSWLTPKFEDSFALVNALRHCALGINVASTVSLELCMFDKPVINVGYNPASVDQKLLSYADYYDFDHYRPIVESGAVAVARNREQMRNLIRESLCEPKKQSLARRELLQKMFGTTLDGRSSERVADCLLNLAASGKKFE